MTNICNITGCWKEATQFITFSAYESREDIAIDARYCKNHSVEQLKSLVKRIESLDVKGEDEFA